MCKPNENHLVIIKPCEELTYEEAKAMFWTGRSVLSEMLELAEKHGDITERERDLMVYRTIDRHTLEETGKKIGVTRERIRQMEARIEMIMASLTKKPSELEQAGGLERVVEGLSK